MNRSLYSLLLSLMAFVYNYIALFSALAQSHSAHVAFDSE